MKAIAIDSASPVLTISAINEDLKSTVILDIGMHQSERILVEIERVLNDVNLKVADLEFAALCKGPGTFTGLRLSFAALKALQLNAHFPIYAFDSLYVYAFPFLSIGKPILSCLDAKKHRFYVSLFRKGQVAVESFDAELEQVKNILDTEEELILTGPDAEYFAETYYEINPNQKFTILGSEFSNTGFALLSLGKKAFDRGDEGLKDYEGPVYIRPSEAEEAKLAGEVVK